MARRSNEGPRTPMLVALDGGPQPLDRFTWERTVQVLALGRTTKYIALMLATYTSAGGDNAHPGVERLAANCECDERTVRRHLTRLGELGLIERTFCGSQAGRRKLADVYRLTMPADPRKTIGLVADPATDTPAVGPQSVDRAVDNRFRWAGD